MYILYLLSNHVLRGEIELETLLEVLHEVTLRFELGSELLCHDTLVFSRVLIYHVINLLCFENSPALINFIISYQRY